MEIQLVEVVLLVISLLSAGLAIYSFLQLRSARDSFQRLSSGVVEQNLEELLREHLEKIKVAIDKSEDIEKSLQDFKNYTRRNLQKVGFKRYNPFEETGGDQSFILALLDQNNDGVIITSMHQRQLTRVYAKKIDKGNSENKLSKEEVEVLNTTIKSK
ncbi:MAG: DUF4446 family protein [Candidatus Dojkabacteria bacterium]|nr:DUF4446 family protein [Candidatus Dojkabacteria bacterium]